MPFTLPASVFYFGLSIASFVFVRYSFSVDVGEEAAAACGIRWPQAFLSRGATVPQPPTADCPVRMLPLSSLGNYKGFAFSLAIN